VNLVGHIALQGKRGSSSRCPAQPLIPFVSQPLFLFVSQPLIRFVSQAALPLSVAACSAKMRKCLAPKIYTPFLHEFNGANSYQATLDAFSLMNQGWCPKAIEAGFGRDRLILMASLFSAMNYNPKSSLMASGALPALVASVFRFIRCLPDDVLFLTSIARTNPFFDEEFEPFSRVNLLVLLNVYANDYYSDALGNAINFDSQVISANALSPFKSFFGDFLPILLGMWPVKRDAFCSNIVQNAGTIACYNQPVLFMHGSLDSETIPQVQLHKQKLCME
jgi:hypothetical protein